MTLPLIKLVHTAIFVVLSTCVLYVCASATILPITRWTWIAVAAIVAEGGVLAVSGGRCPLTGVAERLGSSHGRVSDIFLPAWIADRIFPICTTLFLVGCVLLAFRLLR
ncbi:MAG TPA: hypothetical protein VK437_11580 [Steroidobacteraceae bacterium]|nr:hypothetical protein [Steroidobacteraceae bacterium]